MTTFLQVSNNSKTLAIEGSLDNVTTPIVLNGIDTTSFSEVTTGYVVTIWDDETYSDPGDDPNMERALVTAATIDSNGSFTLSRPFAQSHIGTPRVALLLVAQHITDLITAITELEGKTSNVNNTSDMDKPVSTATQAALNGKVDVSEVMSYQFTPISLFDSGHGFTKKYAPGIQIDDTTDGYFNSHSLLMTTGTGNAARSGRSISPLDLTRKQLVIAVKVDNNINIAGLTVFLSSDGMVSDYYYINASVGQLKDSEWVAVTLSFADAQTVGNPNRAAIDTVDIRVQSGATPVSVKLGLIGYMDEPSRAVCSLTFDDGRISQYTNAKPSMDKYGMPGTAYIISSVVGSANYVSTSQLAEMQDHSGWDIAAHTHTHPDLRSQTDSQIEAEFIANKQWLVDNKFYKGSDHLAYPIGGFNYTNVAPIAAKYFATARTIVGGSESTKLVNNLALRTFYVKNTTTLLEMQTAVTNSITNNTWLIFTFHSIVDTPANQEEFSKALFFQFIDWLAVQAIDIRTVSDVCGSSERLDVKADKALTSSALASKFDKSGGIVSGRVNAALSAAQTGFSQTRASKTLAWGATATAAFNVTNETDGIELMTLTQNSLRIGSTSAVGIIYGAGFPNGVSAAPVGSIYFDTVVTSGVSTWIKKSGAGNTGWKVLEGDTGLRVIVSWDTAGTVTGTMPNNLSVKAGKAGYVGIRRIGNLVTLFVKEATIGGLVNITNYSGFRTTAPHYPMIPLYGTSAGFMQVGGSFYFLSMTSGSLPNDYTMEVQFQTDQAWPTTLPGTAA